MGGRGVGVGCGAVLFLSKYTEFPPCVAKRRRGVRKRRKKKKKTEITSYSERTDSSYAAFNAPLLSLSKLQEIKWRTPVSG